MEGKRAPKRTRTVVLIFLPREIDRPTNRSKYYIKSVLIPPGMIPLLWTTNNDGEMMASEREMRRMVLWGEMTARHVTPHDTLELTPQGELLVRILSDLT